MDPAPFVGRAHLLRTLDDSFVRARGGDPQVLLCGGEPGVGKTRLATEVVARHGAHTTVVWARAHDDPGTPPFWLWRQVLRRLAAADPDDTAEQVLDARRELPDASRTFGSGVDRFALFESVVTVVERAARARPLLVIIDDAHWADEPSLHLLRYLVRELRGAPVCMLINHRTVGTPADSRWPEIAAVLRQEHTVHSFELRGLEPGECAVLLRAELGPEAGAEPIGRYESAADLHAITGGNPFFLREIARARRDPRAGEQQDAHGSHSARPLPRSVVEVVRRRVDGLADDTAHVLRAAAVLGQRFSVRRAAATADLDVLAVFPLLDDAHRAGMVEPASDAGSWQFVHALVRDAVEASLPRFERARLHERAAEVLDADHAAGAMVAAADIARHRLAAVTTDPRAAIDACRAAARDAVAALAYESGIEWYRAALTAGDATLAPVDRATLQLELAHACWSASDLSSCTAAVRAATDAARRAPRVDLVVEAALVRDATGGAEWDSDVRRTCEDALVLVGPHDASATARLHARIAETAVYLGDHDVADTASDLALQAAEASEDATAIVAALRARQIARSAPEHVDERAGLATRMIEAAVVLRRPQLEMWGRLWRIDAHWERGDTRSVEEEIVRLDVAARRVGGPLARWHVLITRGALACALGRYTEALELGRVAYETSRSTENPASLGSYLALLGVVGHAVGHDDAMASASPGLGPPSDDGEMRNAIFAYVGAALVAAETGRPDEARQVFAAAGPPETWRPPPFFRVLSAAWGSLVAVSLGLEREAATLHEMLRAERGRFVVAGAGTSSFGGPVELHLGRSATFLGRLDEAIDLLGSARDRSLAMGAEGSATEAGCELARALTMRAVGDDVDRAMQLALVTRADAVRLGMAPWVRRLDELVAPTRRAGDGPAPGPDDGAISGLLSAREREVAALVAAGCTNREIAARLFVSVRTAQTHVQHILTKLGFTRRSQIASWFTTVRPPAADEPAERAGRRDANT